ncbi:hypothetical protein O9992_17215 [Vibrio lentus]|nr:hypothetical protein [Vibrio lentus]
MAWVCYCRSQATDAEKSKGIIGAEIHQNVALAVSESDLDVMTKPV